MMTESALHRRDLAPPFPRRVPRPIFGINGEESGQTEKGPRTPHACEGGARAADADRAGTGKVAQSRHREGNRGRRIADGTNRAGEAEGAQRAAADNSWDRREDLSAAHRARKSTREAPQTSTPLPDPPPQGGREGTVSGE